MNGAIPTLVCSKMQVPKQLKEASGRPCAGDVFKDRARRLKVLANRVVIRRGQVDLNLERRHVRAKLPGVVVRKRQGGCLSLELAYDLANRVQVEVADTDSLVGSGLPTWTAEPMASPSMWIMEIGGKCSVAWSGAWRDRSISSILVWVSRIMNGCGGPSTLARP
jgi:hypothetical protein